jgi:hypothetical protein
MAGMRKSCSIVSTPAASNRVDNFTVANTLARHLQTTLLAPEGTGPCRLPSINVADPPQWRVILFRPVFDPGGHVKSFQEIGARETK